MTTDLTKTLEAIDASKLAYIRGIDAAELAALPNEVLSNVDDVDELFVVTNGDGEKLAIIEGRDAAMATVRANEMQPLSLH